MIRDASVPLLAALVMGCTAVLDPSGFVRPARDAGPFDAGPRRDGGTSDAGAPPDAGVTLGSGVIEVLGEDGRHRILGVFDPRPLEELRQTGFVFCAREMTAGSCSLARCAGSQNTVRAGVLTVQVGGETTMTTDVPTSQYITTGFAPLVPGGTVGFSASGAEVPAFSGEVVAPAELSAVLPTSIRRDQALTVRWTPLAAEEVELETYAGNLLIRCRAAGSAGSVTIPAALNAATIAADGELRLTSMNTTQLRVGGWDVLLIAGHKLRSAYTYF